ncbi:MAG: DUF1549 domain-containing protein [Planctomycetaceae bacterium]
MKTIHILFTGFIVLTCASSLQADQSVSFRNQVMAVLSKAGCNAGVCHGNAHGKGGFKLSLRGYDPSSDFLRITRELNGRRANRFRPEQSLLLLKPTMKVAHEGGRRFAETSLEYKILRDWIAAGMPADKPGKPRLTGLKVIPQEKVLYDPASSLKLQVFAEFSNGTTREVTRLAVYEPVNSSCEVTSNGLVRRLGFGENTVTVRYLNQHQPVRLAFVPARPDYQWRGPQPANDIDRHVFAKLKKLRINPSAVIDDATFIRRVSLDLLGILPTAEEARTFVKETRPDKRARLIDRLLQRPEFVDFWTLKWSDLLRNEEKTLDRTGVKVFHAWIRKSIAEDKPLNQFARELIASRGSTYKQPAANFYRAMRDPQTRAESTAQLFLGIRLQCAKCHNHPFDRWTQDDYYGWANNFARIKYKILQNKRKDKNDKHEFNGEQIVLIEKTGDVINPLRGKPTPPRFLGESVPVDSTETDRLIRLSKWISDPANQLFARSQANRIWYQVMGKGIVDPIDDFRATNPPVNSELLDALANDFAKNGFRIRPLLRKILNSKTYQLSAVPNATNREDEINFSRAYIRRLSAEQLLDSISQVVGTPVAYNGYPLGKRASQLYGVQAVRRRDRQPSLGDQFLKLFGKPARLQTCECERSAESTLPQTFQMVSGPLLNSLLTQPENRIGRILKSNKSNHDIVDDLYWTTLTRPPRSQELATCVSLLEKSSNRRQTLEDILWALMNSSEFLFRR